LGGKHKKGEEKIVRNAEEKGRRENRKLGVKRVK
jgi:hypothetical protein